MNGKAQREGASSGKSLTVLMEVDILDCPICFEPLMPPIFQCSVGHFICSSCQGKHLDQKCHLCSTKTSFKRCFGMEQVVQSVKVPCPNAMYGCPMKFPYYQKGHELDCPAWGCFCPVPSCSLYFYGPTEALLEHMTTEHQLPSTTLPDSGTASVHLQQGFHALRDNRTNYLFVLSLSLLPVGHAISIFCVQPKVMKPQFTCNISYDCFTTGFSESSSCHIRSTSLSDGCPTGYDLILPKGKFPDDQKSILLRITIHQVFRVSKYHIQGKGPASAPQRRTPARLIIISLMIPMMMILMMMMMMMTMVMVVMMIYLQDLTVLFNESPHLQVWAFFFHRNCFMVDLIDDVSLRFDWYSRGSAWCCYHAWVITVMFPGYMLSLYNLKYRSCLNNVCFVVLSSCCNM